MGDGVMDAQLAELQKDILDGVDRDGSGPKFARIKSRLKRFFGNSPAGTKLPTLRELAELFQVTQPPVQRAVAELVEEGVLFVKPRSGIFVAAQGTSMADEPVPMAPRTLKLVTSPLYSPQRRFWRRAIAEFERQNRFLRVVHEESSGPVQPQSDIFEKSVFGGGHGRRCLDLREAFAAMGEVSAPEQWPVGDGGYTAGLFYPCAILNVERLEALGIKDRTYTSFAGQAAFIRRLLDAAAGRDSSPLANNLQPLIWFGGNAVKVVDAIISGGGLAGLPAAAPSQTDELVSLFRLLNPFGALPGERLLKGDFTVLFNWSYVVPALRESLPGRELEVVPLFACDDRRPCLPHALALHTDTLYPLEGLRFLSFLRSAAARRLMDDCQWLPFEPEAQGWPRDMIEIMGAHRSQAENYLHYNMILDELSHAIDAGDSGSHALERMMTLGKAYLAITKGQELKAEGAVP